MSKLVRYILIVFLFGLFILIRAYASQLFYDPLINYFKNDYLHKSIPKMDQKLFYLHLFFRYILNAVISVGIIYLVFKNKNHLKFSVQFYGFAFIVLFVMLIWLINTNLFSSHLPLFYIRRFLIHPIFVLLLLPAFYYQNNHVKT